MELKTLHFFGQKIEHFFSFSKDMEKGKESFLVGTGLLIGVVLSVLMAFGFIVLIHYFNPNASNEQITISMIFILFLCVGVFFSSLSFCLNFTHSILFKIFYPKYLRSVSQCEQLKENLFHDLTNKNILTLVSEVEFLKKQLNPNTWEEIDGHLNNIRASFLNQHYFSILEQINCLYLKYYPLLAVQQDYEQNTLKFNQLLQSEREVLTHENNIKQYI